MGSALQGNLLELELVAPLLVAAADGTLDDLSFARLMRKRRDYPPYLRKLLARLEGEGRLGLAQALCENVTRRLEAPRFRRRLEVLRQARAEAGT